MALTRVAAGMMRLSVGRFHPMLARTTAATTSTAFIKRNRPVGITMPSASRAQGCQPVRYSSATWRAQDAATTQSVHSFVVLEVTSPPHRTIEGNASPCRGSSPTVKEGFETGLGALHNCRATAPDHCRGKSPFPNSARVRIESPANRSLPRR